MATLWIREFNAIPQIGVSRGSSPKKYGEGAPMPVEPGTDQTPVTFSTSVQSAAFASTTTYIVVVGSVDFHYVVGSNPSATTSALKIPANTPWAVAVTNGHKIAAIAAA